MCCPVLYTPAGLRMVILLSARTLARTIAPYPTQGEVWKRLGDAWQRACFTARVKAIVQIWLRWMR